MKISIYQPNPVKIALFSLFLLFIPIQSYGKDITFQWTANPEPLVGYKLYYTTRDDNTPPYDGTGITEGISPIPIIGQTTTTYTVTGLSDTETYHFALTAYDENGESDYSATVTVTPDLFLSPTILSIMVIQ
ncbi:MAG: fibronectin type III domain-containing protein [Desulfobulbaceae bacterium]|nr:fibronectin type III domain-containing protein [Desulfobulbaceae bacterium]